MKKECQDFITTHNSVVYLEACAFYLEFEDIFVYNSQVKAISQTTVSLTREKWTLYKIAQHLCKNTPLVDCLSNDWLRPTFFVSFVQIL
jgi:hypothetical protein